MQLLYGITHGFTSVSGLLPQQQHPGDRREIKPHIQPRGCCLSNGGGGRRDPGSAARVSFRHDCQRVQGTLWGKKRE